MGWYVDPWVKCIRPTRELIFITFVAVVVIFGSRSRRRSRSGGIGCWVGGVVVAVVAVLEVDADAELPHELKLHCLALLLWAKRLLPPDI